jgi:putative hydrolase of the HAD superfamily
MFEVIAFDADDTLWHNERLYARAQATLRALLAPYVDGTAVDQALYATEMRNLPAYGYGIKSFALSMIETAVTLSNGRVNAAEVRSILAAVRAMIDAEVELLPGVAAALAELAPRYRLMVITKGDLLDQERKLAKSGLAAYFHAVEVVSRKTADVYRGLLERYAVDPARFVMVGNSLRSDVLPAAAVGGTAVYVPHDLTWAHEQEVDPLPAGGYHEIPHIGALPALLTQLQETD